MYNLNHLVTELDRKLVSQASEPPLKLGLGSGLAASLRVRV